MTNKNTLAIYSAGLIQGIVLVAFPAVSTIITDPDAYAFSSTAYGSLFIPQSVISITASASNPFLTAKLGMKRLFLLGIGANLVSMLLLALSALLMHHFVFAYAMLLMATGALGLGFGFVVPTINEMAVQLYPRRVDSVVLMLNALLGVGTASAPVFTMLFVLAGFWWGLPMLLVLLLALLVAFSSNLRLPEEPASAAPPLKLVGIPGRFWIFAAFALLYGVIETLNGNWVSIYMRTHLHATIQVQSLALTAFWGMVTFGRVLFSFVGEKVNDKIAFQVAPFITTAAFILIASLSSGAEYFAVIAFGLTGLGCSVLLPLIISFGTAQLRAIASSIPGMVITCYLLGYGIAAFGVGPLEEAEHITLRNIYFFGALIAFALGIISLLIIRDKRNCS